MKVKAWNGLRLAKAKALTAAKGECPLWSGDSNCLPWPPNGQGSPNPMTTRTVPKILKRNHVKSFKVSFNIT